MAQPEPKHLEEQAGSAGEPQTDSLYGLTTSLVHAVETAISADNATRVRELIRPLHESDLADLIGCLTWDQRLRLIDAAGSQFSGEVLAYLDEGTREQVMRGLLPDEIAAAIAELDSDDTVSVLQDLDGPERREILEALPSADRADIDQSLAYPESSAGRLMQRAVVGLPANWTAG
ncbi:MAG: magnesium transporter [Alphaproteobacteria bacterium]|nr:magnesium transporter [Alphaproteobacteria bacterium]